MGTALCPIYITPFSPTFLKAVTIGNKRTCCISPHDSPTCLCITGVVRVSPIFTALRQPKLCRPVWHPSLLVSWLSFPHLSLVIKVFSVIYFEKYPSVITRAGNFVTRKIYTHTCTVFFFTHTQQKQA